MNPLPRLLLALSLWLLGTAPPAAESGSAPEPSAPPLSPLAQRVAQAPISTPAA